MYKTTAACTETGQVCTILPMTKNLNNSQLHTTAAASYFHMLKCLEICFHIKQGHLVYMLTL